MIYSFFFPFCIVTIEMVEHNADVLCAVHPFSCIVLAILTPYYWYCIYGWHIVYHGSDRRNRNHRVWRPVGKLLQQVVFID